MKTIASLILALAVLPAMAQSNAQDLLTTATAAYKAGLLDSALA